MKYKRIIIILTCVILGAKGEDICNNLDNYYDGLGGIGMISISLIFLYFLRLLYIEWQLKVNNNEI